MPSGETVSIWHLSAVRCETFNVAFVSMVVGAALIYSGADRDRALAHMEHAIRVSPGDPGAFFYWTHAAICQFYGGRNEQAVELAQKSIDIYPDWDTAYWVLVPALVKLDRMDEAQKALEKLRELSPHVTCSLWRQNIPIRDENILEMMVSGLSDARLRE